MQKFPSPEDKGGKSVVWQMAAWMDTVIWIRAEKLGAVQTTNWAAVKVDLVQLTAFLV